jgi:uracil-DNA glycosylase
MATLRPLHLTRYCRDLGWSDPPILVPPQPGGLAELALEAAACGRCRLSERRHKVVFGEGSSTPAVMFIGEAPGEEEDRSGRPFVGQAGQLLEAMLLALELRRDQVYIANVVKCRPPGNRDPEEDEMAACAAFLDRQVELLAPPVIIALGVPALRRLTGSTKTMGVAHGRWSSYRGIPLLATYHPAYLLRNPGDKRLVWDDLKAARRKLR